MKHLLLRLLLLLPMISLAQDREAIDWINSNAIDIEDADPDTELLAFTRQTPERFAAAKIYGFGEASHNTKEFFDLKAKFFKHLVKTQGVKVFIMEESIQAEAGINTWISGGQGDVRTIAKHFNTGFWYTKEIVNLLKWMRDYNTGRPRAEQIRFYGMDMQLGKRLNQDIRDLVTKHNLAVDENLLTVADSSAIRKLNYTQEDSWWQNHLPKLNELRRQILDATKDLELPDAGLRSLDYLMEYVEYASLITRTYPTSTMFRDLKMFENVKFIIENESENGKAFIWAHNDHISKREMYYTGSGIINLGRLLKDWYNEAYYSVGFDFGTGKIKGYVQDKKKGNYWKTYHIEKPFKKTFAYTLQQANKDIYFIDLQNTHEFFTQKNKHLLIGGGGYQPKPLHRIMVNKIYTQTYDGLIYVKYISVPDTDLD